MPSLPSNPDAEQECMKYELSPTERKKFENWKELPHGGRLYCLPVQDRSGWRACYFKEVDVSERTLRFWQEIYNQSGILVEIHEKYPVDKGHRKV